VTVHSAPAALLAERGRCCHGGPGNGAGGHAPVPGGIGAYLSVCFLLRYFQTRRLTPFAIYCTVAGHGSLTYLTLT
jgi:undecaprenyl-diphosphatase